MYSATANALASNLTPSLDGNQHEHDELAGFGARRTPRTSSQSGPSLLFALLKLSRGRSPKLTNGEIVTGTNVENVSYGLTICAERAALVRAVAQFGPEIRIEAVAVANLNDAASPPCGACRQVLAEFAHPGTLVAFPAATGMQTMSFADLLPLGFDMKLK